QKAEVKLTSSVAKACHGSPDDAGFYGCPIATCGASSFGNFQQVSQCAICVVKQSVEAAATAILGAPVVAEFNVCRVSLLKAVDPWFSKVGSLKNATFTPFGNKSLKGPTTPCPPLAWDTFPIAANIKLTGQFGKITQSVGDACNPVPGPHHAARTLPLSLS